MNFWIQPSQLDPRVLGGELPTNHRGCPIARLLPGGDLVNQNLPVCYAPTHTLPLQNGQLTFRAMLSQEPCSGV